MDAFNNTQLTVKSFWARPEGKTAMVVLGALGLTIGLNWAAYIMPILVSVLEDTLYSMFLFGGIAAIVMLLAQKRFRTLISYGFKSLMRLLTSVYKTIDPVGILKGYVEKLNDWRSDMQEQISKVSGRIRVLKEKIAKNKKEIADSIGIAQAARASGSSLVAQKNARMAGRRQDSNMTYEDMLQKLEAMYAVLVKYDAAAEFMIADISDEVEIAIEKKKEIDAAKKAMDSAKKILAGGTDDKLLYDETMEFLAEDYGQKLGEIEDFMRMSRSTIEQIDIENMAAETSVFKMLDEWGGKESVVLDANGQPKRKELTAKSTPISLPVDTRQQVPVSAPTSFIKRK